MNSREAAKERIKELVKKLRSGINARRIYVDKIEKICKEHRIELKEVEITEEEMNSFKMLGVPPKLPQTELSL